MEYIIALVLLIPILVAVMTYFCPNYTSLIIVNISGSTVISCLLLYIVYLVINTGPVNLGIFYIDDLSAVLLLIVALLNFTGSLYSATYIRNEYEEGIISFQKVKVYYALLQMFIITMIFVLIVGNLGLMWVGVESTTLSSALLVAFYFHRVALEAAWKYVMVCTVGICMALLGAILLYYAQVNVLGGTAEALNWLLMKDIAPILDKSIVKLAFVFILIGYGTKIGIAPMHTWLPDAHSQAPSPISGLLSGAVLSCAMYALIRNLIVIQGTLGVDYVKPIIIAFGLLSIAISIPFIIVQHDIKRLLAYSSVEHMGLILLGIGVGTPLAVFAALFHMLNHAINKSMLFYLAGSIIQQYRTKNILRIRGIIKSMPLLGSLFIVSGLAITGTPPFSIFASKIMLVGAIFADGQYILGITILLLLAGIFSGMMYYMIKMIFGNSNQQTVHPIGRPAAVALTISLACMIITGICLPQWLSSMLNNAAVIVLGG